jgi:hypothetical protein
MTCEPPPRGAHAPLVPLATLPPDERRVVETMRLWRCGLVGQRALLRGYADRRGPAAARATLDRLDAFLCLAVVHARRPLAIAPAGAESALGDECLLARLVALAVEGSREQAILIGALLVRADLALELARRGLDVGLDLRRSDRARAASWS